MTALVSEEPFGGPSTTSTSPSLYADESLPSESPSCSSSKIMVAPSSCSAAIPRSLLAAEDFFCGHPLQQQVVPVFESATTNMVVFEDATRSDKNFLTEVPTAVEAYNSKIDEELSVSKDFVRRGSDPNLQDDERVLVNFLNAEEKTRPKRDYFQTVQTEVTPQMREVLTQWMSDVCEEERVDHEIFPLACHYLDRFLSKDPVYKTQLQGLACACIFVASKIKQPQPFAAKELVKYTDDYVSLGELMSWELLLLNRLSWDVSTVTAFEFVDHLLPRMKLPSCLVSRMRPLINEFIKLMFLEFQLAILQPSLQACICICLAGIRVLEESEALPNLLAAIHSAIGFDPAVLRVYIEGVNDYLKRKNNNDESEQNREETRDSTAVTTASSA